MTACFFVSDLHGHPERYEKLWSAIEEETPAAVFLGGDLLPSGLMGMVSLDPAHRDFVNDFLVPGFERVRTRLGAKYPKVFLILGNDDGRFEETAFLDVASTGLWLYSHDRAFSLLDYRVFGSAYVPPGCVSPEEAGRAVLNGDRDLDNAVLLFHGPPFETNLDRVSSRGPVP